MTNETAALVRPPPPLVAFDFDGTLTVRDSYTWFLIWRAGPAKAFLGAVRLLPAALAWMFHRDRGRIKAAATRVFLAGATREQLEADARAFAGQVSRRLLRPDAILAWKRWRNDEVRLVIVTASPEIVVAPFARGLGADGLIGTDLAFDDQDRATGGFAGPNCRGSEKVVRIRAVFGDRVAIRAAYGDTTGDTEMLAAADEPYYRVFTGRP
jgi:phosphatidylglycerophosphatase C